MSDQSQTIGERIKLIIKEKNLSQAQLARDMGRTSQNISDAIRGKNSRPMELVNYLCKRFGVSFDWLFYGNGEVYTTDSYDLDNDNDHHPLTSLVFTTITNKARPVDGQVHVVVIGNQGHAARIKKIDNDRYQLESLEGKVSEVSSDEIEAMYLVTTYLPV